MNSNLREIFNNPEHRIIDKWQHYFDVYERHFKHLVGQKPIHMLEIGVYKGGSLEMWSNYFGKDNCIIYGIDINPECKILERDHDNIKIFIGDQADKEFIKSVCQQIPKLDIVLDDGGHTMSQQINTFEVIYDHIKPGGVYMCEDVCTSYWPIYGGGYQKEGTFVEYMKDYIDKLNAYWTQESTFRPDEYTKSMDSIHFYDSIVVIDKAKVLRSNPIRILSGKYNLDGTSIQ